MGYLVPGPVACVHFRGVFAIQGSGLVGFHHTYMHFSTFREMREQYFKTRTGFLLLFALYDKRSFEDVEKLRQQVILGA